MRTTEIMKTLKTTQTATNKEFSAGSKEITGTTEMTKTTAIRGAKPRVPHWQTTCLETPEIVSNV